MVIIVWRRGAGRPQPDDEQMVRTNNQIVIVMIIISSNSSSSSSSSSIVIVIILVVMIIILMINIRDDADPLPFVILSLLLWKRVACQARILYHLVKP